MWLKALDFWPLFFFPFFKGASKSELVALAGPCFEEWGGGKSIKNRSQDVAFQRKWLLIYVLEAQMHQPQLLNCSNVISRS